MIRFRKLGWLSAAFILAGCGTDRVSSTPPSSENTVDVGVDTGLGSGTPGDLNCPNTDNPVGFSVGDTFPSTRYPNSDWEGVNIKSLCGSRAILVVSATEWCTACLVEFDYLAMVAEDWADRGGEVYYTLFENSARQPPGKETLATFEDYMLEIYGSVPFRVLSDPAATLPRSINNGGVTLPLAWALNEELVIVNFAEGTSGPMVTAWMENLLR